MDQDDPFPDCVKTPANVIHEYFSNLDSLVSHLIMRIAGYNNTNWMIPNHQQTTGNLCTSYYDIIRYHDATVYM